MNQSKLQSHIGKYRVIDSTTAYFFIYDMGKHKKQYYNIKQTLIDGRTETLPYGFKT